MRDIRFFCDQGDTAYAVVEFQKEYFLRGAVSSAQVEIFADTKFWLYQDKGYVGTGPVHPGGDYGFTQPMEKQYSCVYDLHPQGESMTLFVRVQLSPCVMCDVSCGHGGLMVSGEICYADGTKQSIRTDATWAARLNRGYTSDLMLDASVLPDSWRDAQEIESRWHVEPAPVAMLQETIVSPVEKVELQANAGQEKLATLEWPKIYSAFTLMKIETDTLCQVTVTSWEIPGQEGITEVIRTDHSLQYRGLRMMSTGGITVRLQCLGQGSCRVRNIGLSYIRYPGEESGYFRCSDEGLNQVNQVCRWTLQFCRQWLHLDSPRHQETLGCTGDYYVESLMEYFTYADTRLVRLDLVRTADWLVQHGGVMFHTSYSLVWVRMLRDYVLHTGDRTVLDQTGAALDILLKRFAGYMGDNGLVEHAPDYMFVDWRTVDGYSLHHPPKALGQTCLNAFYHGALLAAEDLYRWQDLPEKAASCAMAAERLCSACNRLLFDPERQLYAAGLTTPGKTNRWQPENPSKGYFIRQANALAVWSGLCRGEHARRLMIRVMEDVSLTDVQPYFAHFVLDALAMIGLFEQYGMPFVCRWKGMVEQCGKGLQEGWTLPEDGYTFDYSHAWGGTPAYQLPCRLMGVEILSPGWKRVRLHGALMGLDWFEAAVPTPLGILRCRMEKGKAAVWDIPPGMEIVWD